MGFNVYRCFTFESAKFATCLSHILYIAFSPCKHWVLVLITTKGSQMKHTGISVWLITTSQVNCNVWSWTGFFVCFAAHIQTFYPWIKYWVISSDNAAFVDLSVQWLNIYHRWTVIFGSGARFFFVLRLLLRLLIQKIMSAIYWRSQMKHLLIYQWLNTISQVNCNIWIWSWSRILLCFAPYTQAFYP